MLSSFMILHLISHSARKLSTTRHCTAHKMSLGISISDNYQVTLFNEPNKYFAVLFNGKVLSYFAICHPFQTHFPSPPFPSFSENQYKLKLSNINRFHTHNKFSFSIAISPILFRILPFALSFSFSHVIYTPFSPASRFSYPFFHLQQPLGS
jgi:hypothetical protein